MKNRMLVATLLFCCSLFSSYLTQEEVDTFYKQGYFIKRNALLESELKLMDQKSSLLLKRILNELDKEIYPFSEQDQKIYIEGTQIVFIKKHGKTPSIKRFVGCESIEQSFQKVLRSKKMKETFFALLNTDAIEQIISQYHPKVPGDGVAFIKHRDIRYRKEYDSSWEDIGGNGSYAVCIIAIDPMSKENGGLIIDKKSYPKQDGSDIEQVVMQPGDMLFMHPEILHWSESNFSSITRRALLAGYCVYGANHRNYPGDCTNEVTLKNPFTIRDAPWRVFGDTNF